MKKLVSQLLVALVCLLLGFLLTHQFKKLSMVNGSNIDYDNANILSEIENLKKKRKIFKKIMKYYLKRLKSLKMQQQRKEKLKEK